MLALGISAHAPDAAAVLVRDGRPLAAAREELFSGVRSDPGFPRRAVRACLLQGGVSAEELEAVAFFTKPLRKFERELATLLQGFPSTAGPFAQAMFRWLGERLWMRGAIVAELGLDPAKILFTEHHLAHAASAFLTSPFEEAAVLTTGADGEWATTALSSGRGGAVEVRQEIHHPHGLSRLSGAVARFLALDPLLDEHKLMALAGYGEPRFLAELGSLVAVRPDGSFEFGPALTGPEHGRAEEAELARLLGPPRAPDEPLRFSGSDRRDADVARSLREVLVNLNLALLRALFELAPSKNLCLGGTLARDPALNARLLAEGPFERVFVDPAAGNAAAACGAALLAGAQGSAQPGRPGPGLDWVRLGPQAAGPAGEGALELADGAAAVAEVARRLAAGQLGGWLRGPAEFSGRSLGGRALLADPRSVAAAERIRQQIKRREPFVPFGALATAEQAASCFHLPAGAPAATRHGMLVVRVREASRAALAAVIHADDSVRLCTVAREDDPLLHALLERFREATGVPVLLHTTLRLHGEPMARCEADGLRVLQRSQLDFLLVEGRLYEGR